MFTNDSGFFGENVKLTDVHRLLSSLSARLSLAAITTRTSSTAR
jgi:hypothetical protein